MPTIIKLGEGFEIDIDFPVEQSHSDRRLLLRILAELKHQENQNKERFRLIMAQAQELIDAATTLSTAADGLSVKTDKLIASAEKLITALGGISLPPAADAALAAMKTSIASAAAEGDKVDAEVAKVDGVLPNPAPPAPPTP